MVGIISGLYPTDTSILQVVIILKKKKSPDIAKCSLDGQISGSPELIIYVNLLKRGRKSMKDKKK